MADDVRDFEHRLIRHGIRFHHPVAFWIGCMAVIIGVLAHMPMFAMAAPVHYHLAGMPMDTTMLVGMALIPAGAVLAGYGLLPRRDELQLTLRGNDHVHFHVADGLTLNREHWKLIIVLIIALAIDVMKPATLGFVIPGMSSEYDIAKSTAGYLALFALIGTTVGSIVWGRLADVCGRRSAILLSAILFMGTAICGAMPSFGWNLLMCFMMGAAAGGMLPIAFTLMAETIPAAHRGWLLVTLGGLGTSAGYLLASGAATIFEPLFSWRSLWLLNLPTGALIIFLNRYIPESPRFLANVGLNEEARAVLKRFSAADAGQADIERAADPVVEVHLPKTDLRELLRGRHARITWGLLLCGLAWGLVNFGFLLWLPANLSLLGIDAKATNLLLAQSAVYALPAIALVVWVYQRWSSIRSLVLLIGFTVMSLLAFFAIDLTGMRSTLLTTIATVALLSSVSGVIATLIPYAAEIYPVHLRGTGSGLIAASSKAGGIAGAVLGVLGLFNHIMLSAIVIAVPMAIAAIMLVRSGVETRGYRLEEIQTELLR
jgi:putative MFS transporter